MKPMNIARRFPETQCLECLSVLSWDSVGDITDRTVKIDAWCPTCKNHRTVTLWRSHELLHKEEGGAR